MEKMIGRGKFGTVYTAINQRTNQLMAMKQIERKDQRELMSLIDEVKNLTGIQHPNLVRYYGYEVHRVGPCVG
jgi:serine/threonine protein kinase